MKADKRFVIVTDIPSLNASIIYPVLPTREMENDEVCLKERGLVTDVIVIFVLTRPEAPMGELFGRVKVTLSAVEFDMSIMQLADASAVLLM